MHPVVEHLASYRGAEKHGTWREVAPDILAIPFWQEGFCRMLVEASELLGGDFRPYEKDVANNAAPGQELRIDLVDPRIAEAFEQDIQQRAVPVIRKHWWPLKPGKVRMPFVLRYSADTQASLDPHHDAAMVSFAMLLNRDYDGGALAFPRQHWDSRDVEIGTLLAFPSQVTHVHRVEPVASGTRYAMTAWMAPPNQYPPDAVVR